MFVIPTWIFQSHKPRTYRKQIRKLSEIVGATCRVRTIISFLDKWTPKEIEFMVDGVPMTAIDYDCKKGEQYGFEIKVDLSKSEYEKHRINLEEYACEKVKKQCDYQNVLNDCINKYADGREYTVEIFVPKHEPNAIDVKWVHNEYEEYVPI
jgi:hypothetical protein